MKIRVKKKVSLKLLELERKRFLTNCDPKISRNLGIINHKINGGLVISKKNVSLFPGIHFKPIKTRKKSKEYDFFKVDKWFGW